MKFLLLIFGLLSFVLMSATASAQYFSYSTDFDSYTVGNPFIGDGWIFFHTNGSEPSYFGSAPQGPQISNLVAGVPASNLALNVYADYTNPRLATDVLTNNVFQQRLFSGADAALGETWVLSFDYKAADGGNGPSGATTTAAFIRVLDNADNILKEEFFDTTAAGGPGFSSGKVLLTFDPGWTDGGVVHFGFAATLGGWGVGTPPDSSGVYYDNVKFEPLKPLSLFCSDFEDLLTGPEYTPIGDGWKFFHTNVAGMPETNYGGDAPRGPQISNLADAEGDPGKSGPQDPLGGGGNKYLNIYSDYNNFQPNPALTNRVYQEQKFSAADAELARTWTLKFDYADAAAPFGIADQPGTSATTSAFIRAFDDAFNLLADVTLDTTTAPRPDFATGEISLTMDPGWTNGGIIQFGFTSTRDGGAAVTENTGHYYDNVCFFVLGDANGDGVVNNLDIAAFSLAVLNRPAYLSVYPNSDPESVLDMNGDGSLNNLDIVGFGAVLGF